MSDSEQFTVVTSSASSHRKVFEDWEAINGAVGFNPDTSLQAALHRQYPDLALTVTTNGNGTSSAAPWNKRERGADMKCSGPP